MSTIFTKIINREIPADIVYEDEHVLAFNDIEPQAPHHVLIIPKREIHTLNDLTEGDAELVGRLHITASRIARERGFADQGYRVVMNCNEYGGQSVYHIHLHLMGGRQMSWPAG
ncbi:histidine triad nucleotide-binding protein [Larsenimonas suaedae]|uniref:Histidine triad nucleotide-binding protein n=1 Tax=Larsenimonas suaedae TaxID=1851019 RepID=A0ABU1GU75_9GAMM|nr:histidine triad nucleotide-binding protein [Larsenimonas suaedae]MCM2971838.1 histidine triad nucleotide-binding protein [Larsenimonas suaedae]MDR5895390.1 histidine triad nucleotide-binding protein [Larsenimonas suaedae]